MAVQYDSVPRAVADYANVTVTLGVAAIGGGVGVRLIVDDAVLTSKEQAQMAIEALAEAVTRRTWPAT